MAERGFVARVERFTEALGRTIAWLVLAMVLAEFTVVVFRHVFGLGSIRLQESVVYLHACVFMLGAGYALAHDAHVRCDIFHARWSARTRALVDIAGVAFFLLPVCGLIAYTAWPYVGAAWAVREGSMQGPLGIPAVYLLKTVILAFPALLGLQALALVARAWERIARPDDG